MAFNFNEVDQIRRNGFMGFQPLTSLFEDCTAIPKSRGVYLVLRSGAMPVFLDRGCGGFFKGRNPNVGVDILREKWVSESVVIYIGKAGGSNSKATLHSRLKQYFAFGQGKDVGHYGGRYIWQIENPGELIVCWKALINEEPREVERKLIAEFVNQLEQGHLPTWLISIGHTFFHHQHDITTQHDQQRRN